MVRDWRRVVWAAFAAAALATACVQGAYAQPAEEEPEEAAADGAQQKSSAKKKQDPVEAQRAIEAAAKQLQAGKAEQAVQALSATLASGNLPPAVMARALYVRGMAHRQQRRPAQAVSDLTGALWLKGGLGGEERAEAVRERAAAYADAGLAVPGEDAGPRPPKASSGNWLSGLFGGSAEPPPRPASPPAPPAVRPSIEPSAEPRIEKAESPPAAKSPQAATNGWSSETQVQQQSERTALAPAARPPKAEAPPPRVAPQPAGMEGGYLVQLAAVRTEAEAQALAARAKREHAALLAARQQSIDRAVIGNFGAFYRVRFGPFESAQETETVCARLQGSGLDCMPVSP
jgi:cell division septation protein DedD